MLNNRFLVINVTLYQFGPDSDTFSDFFQALLSGGGSKLTLVVSGFHFCIHKTRTFNTGG